MRTSMPSAAVFVNDMMVEQKMCAMRWCLPVLWHGRLRSLFQSTKGSSRSVDAIRDPALPRAKALSRDVLSFEPTAGAVWQKGMDSPLQPGCIKASGRLRASRCSSLVGGVGFFQPPFSARTPQDSQFVMIARANTMRPTTSANLDRFLNKYRRDETFFLASGQVEPIRQGRQALPYAAFRPAVARALIRIAHPGISTSCLVQALDAERGDFVEGRATVLESMVGDTCVRAECLLTNPAPVSTALAELVL